MSVQEITRTRSGTKDQRKMLQCSSLLRTIQVQKLYVKWTIQLSVLWMKTETNCFQFCPL